MPKNEILTEEQKKQRLGRFSGSEIHKLMKPQGIGVGGKTYITEKVAESLTGQPIKEEFTAASTSWGIDHEDEARLYFEAATGVKVTPGLTLDNERICGTPDGFIKPEEQEQIA